MYFLHSYQQHLGRRVRKNFEGGALAVSTEPSLVQPRNSQPIAAVEVDILQTTDTVQD
jgi:hypothetical protein